MNVAIIGAGATGLFLGNLLEQAKIKYTIFNDGKIGNKILASGNGRCNIANINYQPQCYHNNELAVDILKCQKKLFSLLKNLKIYTKVDSEGRMYPISESSLSVLNVLLKKVNHNIIPEYVDNINVVNNKYIINGKYSNFDRIVLCCGSPAGYKNFKFPKFYDNLLPSLNPFEPSLVGFRTIPLKKISGVRAKAVVKLIHNDKVIHSEAGEVIFKDNGVSGICIMNLSSYYNYLPNKDNCFLEINLVDHSYDDYTCVLHPKLLAYINENKIDPLHFKLKIMTTYDLEFAQVCKGGVKISDVNYNLQLKKDKNIFVGGEMLDVDGVCGGYNLMFAFCCSIRISEVLIDEISNR